MISTTEVKIEKDLAHKQITVSTHFNAKPEAVWQAWTKKDILDKWWAPKPWHAETKKLEFQEGGSWQYAMVGPENQRQNGKFLYTKINAPKSFEATDLFTDEKGFTDDSLPQMHWKCEFRSSGAGTDVKILVTSKTDGALEKILDMGFEEGFKSALGNLEEYLEENR
ncbi:SRPBCC family protein [Chryseolinea lacunae]|uniref:SRPBCC domain-containing protein n=1 Tax=Chryseolinea lacunae TaxID=2801331 RepID=A0ABS1L1J5_9BACT|nr:SRPBCC domain-containing protein [Chryseolinea lacunae]MBL0745569.1 SRPBCC domain-containing protein [Chryseolinea lacunae]